MTMLRLAILGAFYFAASAIARAEPPVVSAQQQARVHYNLGLNHFKLGEYDKALEDFQAGYRCEPRPLFLFNIAQAARLASKPALAIESYKTYIALETDEADPALPEARRQLELLMAEQSKAPPPAPPEPEAFAPTPAVAPPAAPAPVAATVSERPALLIRKPWYKDPLGDVLTGGGVAVLGASVGIWASGYRDMQAGQYSLDKHILDYSNGAQGRQIIGLAGIGLGGALIIAGVVRYLARPSRLATHAARSMDELSAGARVTRRSGR